GGNDVDHVPSGRFILADLEVLAEIVKDLCHVAGAFLRWGGGAVLHAFDEHVEVVDGDAKYVLEECPSGKLCAEFTDDLALALVDEPVDEDVHISANPIFVLRNGDGAQVRVQHLTPGSVLGRV